MKSQPVHVGEAPVPRAVYTMSNRPHPLSKKWHLTNSYTQALASFNSAREECTRLGVFKNIPSSGGGDTCGAFGSLFAGLDEPINHRVAKTSFITSRVFLANRKTSYTCRDAPTITWPSHSLAELSYERGINNTSTVADPVLKHPTALKEHRSENVQHDTTELNWTSNRTHEAENASIAKSFPGSGSNDPTDLSDDSSSSRHNDSSEEKLSTPPSSVELEGSSFILPDINKSRPKYENIEELKGWKNGPIAASTSKPEMTKAVLQPVTPTNTTRATLRGENPARFANLAQKFGKELRPLHTREDVVINDKQFKGFLKGIAKHALPRPHFVAPDEYDNMVEADAWASINEDTEAKRTCPVGLCTCPDQACFPATKCLKLKNKYLDSGLTSTEPTRILIDLDGPTGIICHPLYDTVDIRAKEIRLAKVFDGHEKKDELAKIKYEIDLTTVFPCIINTNIPITDIIFDFKLKEQSGGDLVSYSAPVTYNVLTGNPHYGEVGQCPPGARTHFRNRCLIGQVFRVKAINVVVAPFGYQHAEFQLLSGTGNERDLITTKENMVEAYVQIISGRRFGLGKGVVDAAKFFAEVQPWETHDHDWKCGLVEHGGPGYSGVNIWAPRWEHSKNVVKSDNLKNRYHVPATDDVAIVYGYLFDSKYPDDPLAAGILEDRYGYNDDECICYPPESNQPDCAACLNKRLTKRNLPRLVKWIDDTERYRLYGEWKGETTYSLDDEYVGNGVGIMTAVEQEIRNEVAAIRAAGRFQANGAAHPEKDYSPAKVYSTAKGPVKEIVFRELTIQQSGKARCPRRAVYIDSDCLEDNLIDLRFYPCSRKLRIAARSVTSFKQFPCALEAKGSHVVGYFKLNLRDNRLDFDVYTSFWVSKIHVDFSIPEAVKVPKDDQKAFVAYLKENYEEYTNVAPHAKRYRSSLGKVFTYDNCNRTIVYHDGETTSFKPPPPKGL